MLGDRTRGLTVFAGTRDLIHPDSRRLAERADVSGLAVDPRGRRPAARPSATADPEDAPPAPTPGRSTFPTGTHAAASYAARSRTPPPVRGRGARSANTARRSTR